MQAILLNRSSSLQTALVWLLTLAALALLGLILAQWTWVWLAPRTEPRAQPSAGTGGQAAVARALFGSAPAGGGVAAPAGIPIKLLGVVAASAGHAGFALLQLDAKQLVVREGDDVAPGIRLAQVAGDHVVLERSGVRETLIWPQNQTPMQVPAL